MKTTSLSRSSDPSRQSAAAAVRHRVFQNRKTRRWLAAGLMALVTSGALSGVRAGQLEIIGPAGSGAYGTNVTVLPNGNFVVTDPGYDAPGSVSNVGAVYLYDGATLAIISTLTGSTVNDQVGSGGVTVLGSGNFLACSPAWNSNRGAVTWCSETSGVSGVVSATNSLVGSSANDRIGSGGISPLISMNSYVVRSTSWNGLRGAVTWGNGTTGVTGAVSATNSLVGTTANDQVGSGGVIDLNGNFVVNSPAWDNGTVVEAGAVTLGNGLSGISGAVSAANSLVGSTANDQVGSGGVVALKAGHYVVSSPNWDNGGSVDAGAATWGNGVSGATGAVTSTNSLVGSTAGDKIGSGGVTALKMNGHYVVCSPTWDNGAVVDVGAATRGSGTTGIVGAVSATSSLVGTTAGDQVGKGGATALSNGNYVVSSPSWKNGAIAGAGAVTHRIGTSIVPATVSTANSLVGSTTSDAIGKNGVTALSNGNYVVSSPSWKNGVIAGAGAVTWGDGVNGTTGVVSVANSLVGSSTGDAIGMDSIQASTGVRVPCITTLSNGNYVVNSPFWDNGAAVDAGAVTWGNGTSGAKGVVSPTLSLVGSTTNAWVGSGGVITLTNGNYVVSSPYCFDLDYPGAVTWGNGTSGVTGAVSAANSLAGSSDGDAVGFSGSVAALSDGNYVVVVPFWRNIGAVTWCGGASGATGVVSTGNSLLGGGGSEIGSGGVTILNNGNYLVSSPKWDAGTVANAGAVTLMGGTGGLTGIISAANSALGNLTGGGSSMVHAYDNANSRVLVGYPASNRISLFGYIPEIAVEQPPGENLADGAICAFGAAVDASESLTFTIKNTNAGDLTGLGITIDGSDAALFTVTASPIAPVSGPPGSTTFTVRFAPTTLGVKTAALHIASNDTDENPFDINLAGRGLSFTEDTDSDGLSDAAEFNWSALGFDWQGSQPGLVTSFLADANRAGLYTTSQVQALHLDTPLIQRDGAGLFTLTLGLQKSATLLPGSFLPFPFTEGTTQINGAGKIEFQFTSPENAAFFRLEAR